MSSTPDLDRFTPTLHSPGLPTSRPGSPSRFDHFFPLISSWTYYVVLRWSVLPLFSCTTSAEQEMHTVDGVVLATEYRFVTGQRGKVSRTIVSCDSSHSYSVSPGVRVRFGGVKCREENVPGFGVVSRVVGSVVPSSDRPPPPSLSRGSLHL